MTPVSKHKELIAAIGRLRKQHQEFLANRVFGGWTHLEEELYDKRTTEMKRLLQELDALRHDRK